MKNFINILLRLLGVFRGNVFFLFSRNKTYQNIYFASNATKWRAMEPLASRFKGACVISNDNPLRRESLHSLLINSKIEPLFIENLYPSLEFWPNLIKNISKYNSLNFLDLILLTTISSKLKPLFENTGSENFFYGDDEFYLMEHLISEIKNLAISTSVFMHGRVYEHVYSPDNLIGYSESQIKSANKNANIVNTFVVNLFPNPKQLSYQSLSTIAFYDQSPSEPIYTDGIRQKVLSSIKFIESLEDINLILFGHPESNKIERNEDGIDLALSACSTVAWDNLSKGIPTILFNYEDNLKYFKHLEEFKFFSVNTHEEFKQRIDNYLHNPDFFKSQVKDFFQVLEKNNSTKLDYPHLIEELRKF